MNRCRHKTRILFALILILLPATLIRAETVTYQDSVRDALQHSARIRMKAEDIHISDAVYRQNFAGLYPEISAISRFEKHEALDHRNTGLNTINGEVVGGDVSAWRSSAYLLGQYTLSHWYKKRFEASYYERLRDARVHELDVEMKKILRELTDIFSALAEGKIKLRYTADIFIRLQEIGQLKKQAFAGGQTSFEEVLKAEADMAASEKEMGAIRKEIRENMERLQSYTGKNYGEDAAVEPLVSTTRKPLADVARLIEDMPEYKARLKELEAVRFKAKAASNNFWPDISLYGRYDFYGTNPDTLDNAVRDFRQTAYSAGIMISLPLFDGGVRKWDRRRNTYEIRKQDETIQALREEKGRDIKTLQAGYRELAASLAHYRKLAEQYGKLLDITRKAHGFGERSLLDIREMEKDVLTVERDWRVAEQALAAYEKRLALETDYREFLREQAIGSRQGATGN